ncbi:MAG: OmpA family protein [Methylococcaceae bacterium]
MYKLVTVLLTASLTSCATNPYSGEEKVSNTAKIAAIGIATGVAIGTGIGALIDGDNGARLGASIGAGVGGATGAGVGLYMDRQEIILREKQQSTGVGIERIGDSITLVMPSDITFKAGSADLSSKSKSILVSVGTVLTEYDKTRVAIKGHTDSNGSEQFNRMLAQVRADNVSATLTHTGVDPKRLTTLSFGEAEPVADNKTKEGRALNRRVEISIN